jgi:hypothetical protein
VLTIALLISASAFGADGPDDAATCFPDCSPGYLCHEGTCIEACNPPCAGGFRCTAERQCEYLQTTAPVPVAALPVATPAPAAVAAQMCVQRKFNYIGSAFSWAVMLDGETLGEVGAGRNRCYSVTTGSHQLRVDVRGQASTRGMSRTIQIPNGGLQVDLKQRNGIVLDGTRPL